LPVELALGCEVEPAVDAEGERELEEVGPPAAELPPANELPPAVEAPPAVVLVEWPPPPQEEAEEEEEEEDEDEGEGEERSRFGGFPAGTASESTNTSPRMCSTNWVGTPDWFTGWVNTRCTPVALTVSSLEVDEPPPMPIGSNGLGVGVVFV
jgi:hypothetical protein